MYREERATGVIVHVLDLSALELQALNYRKISRPDCYEARIHGGEVAVVRSRYAWSPFEVHPRQGSTDLYTGTGRLYSICTEGVGSEKGLSKENPVEFDFHGSYHVRDEEGNINPSSHTFDMFPFASIELDDEELLEYPVKREEDLSTFIRTFGARLEQNFWLWFNTLS